MVSCIYSDSCDRTIRLQLASDPGAPMSALLELAAEFPEAVAANPAIRSGLAADPGSISSASTVAIACLLASPVMDQVLADAIDSAAARHWDGDKLAELRAYLSEWRKSGSRRVAFDPSRLGPPTIGLDPAIERTVRGQVLLAMRLGWGGVSGWLDRWDGTDPYVKFSLVDQSREDSALEIFLPGWVEQGATARWEFRGDVPSEAKTFVYVGPGSAVCQFTIDPAGKTDGEVSFMSSASTDSFDLCPSADRVVEVREMSSMLLEAARSLSPGNCVLAIDDGELHVLTIDVAAAYEALAEVSESLAMSIEDADDEEPNSPDSVSAFLDDSVSPSDWEGISGDEFVHALRSRGATDCKFGSHASFKAILEGVSRKVLPRAAPGQAGAFVGDGIDFQLAIADPRGALGFVFGPFTWVDEYREFSVALDPVT